MKLIKKTNYLVSIVYRDKKVYFYRGRHLATSTNCRSYSLYGDNLRLAKVNQIMNEGKVKVMIWSGRGDVWTERDLRKGN